MGQENKGSAGHTPGPWTLTHKAGSNFAVQTFDVRGMMGCSANVYPIFNRSTSAIDGALIHAKPADARLIAAAPDLLEALDGMLDGMPFGPGASEYELVQAGCDPTEARRLSAAYAAIAKARGEQP